MPGGGPIGLPCAGFIPAGGPPTAGGGPPMPGGGPPIPRGGGPVIPGGGPVIFGGGPLGIFIIPGGGPEIGDPPIIIYCYAGGGPRTIWPCMSCCALVDRFDGRLCSCRVCCCCCSDWFCRLGLEGASRYPGATERESCRTGAVANIVLSKVARFGLDDFCCRYYCAGTGDWLVGWEGDCDARSKGCVEAVFPSAFDC